MIFNINGGSGTAIDLGITGASVGEVAAVKTVDANGKPTAWEGAGAVSDVQVGGASVVTDGIASIPTANANARGVTIIATENDSKNGELSYKAIPPINQHAAVFYGLAKAAGANMKSLTGTTIGTYPEAQKSAIASMLDAPESVSGSTPTIAAKAGVQYVCGECATLAVTTPATGVIDVIFKSGSTPTVLTVTPPSGMTMQWANGFDPTSLDANTTYELNVLNGCLGVAVGWA